MLRLIDGYALHSNAAGGHMLKFEFSIKTRDGQRIDSLLIGGRDQADAERKLNQMYRYCEILHCGVKQGEARPSDAASVEDILSLISK